MSIASSQAITGIDAGVYTVVTVEGSVFVDALESGYFEAPDAVMSGDTVSVTLDIASGGAFDTGTYTASETVTSGQALSGVNADLTVPEQMTFTLGGHASSISFSIPWSSVDATQSSQSIALTDFSITIGSQSFYQATTTFSTSPSIQFAYGQMQGITFAFDPAGSPYESVSMSGGMGVTAYTASFPHTEVTAAATATVSSVGLNFAQCYQNKQDMKDNVQKGTVDAGTLEVTVTLGGDGGPYESTVKVTFDQAGNDAKAVALALVTQLNSIDGVDATYDGGAVQIVGDPDYPLASVTFSLPGDTVNIKTDHSGGATVGPTS